MKAVTIRSLVVLGLVSTSCSLHSNDSSGMSGSQISSVTNRWTNITIANGLLSDTVNAVYAVGSNIYAATDYGLSISTDGGTTWITKTTKDGLGGSYVNDNRIAGVYGLGYTIYAATHNGGLSISNDGGTTWTNKTPSDGLGSLWLSHGIYAVKSSIYVATLNGLSISIDGGNGWTNYGPANGLGDSNVLGVFAVGSSIYAATTKGLSISGDNGNTWANKTSTNGLGSNFVSNVYAVGSNVYAATTPDMSSSGCVGGGLSMSNDSGATWTTKTANDGLGSNWITGVYSVGSSIYAATYTSIDSNCGAVTGGLSVSSDGGNTWTNYTTKDGLGLNQVNGVFVTGSTIYAPTNGGLSILNEVNVQCILGICHAAANPM